MFFRPFTKRMQRLDQRSAKARQGVFHLWRNHRMNGALHQSVALQTAQGLRQHLLRDAADLALQRGVTHGAASEDLNDERRPFVRNAVEN